MVVTVKVHGSLREQIPGTITIEDAQTAGEAISRLDIPSSMGLAILLNGRLAHWRTPLHDGDILQLVPQISGGLCADQHLPAARDRRHYRHEGRQ